MDEGVPTVGGLFLAKINEGGSIRRRKVKGSTVIFIFLLQLCDALLEITKVSSTAGPEGPLDVSSTVRGQVVVAFFVPFSKTW